MDLKTITFALWLVGSTVFIGTQSPQEQVKEPELVWHNGTMVEQPIQKEVELKPSTEPERTADITDGVWEQRELVKKHFPQSQWTNALRVMSAENGSGDPSRMSQNRDKIRSIDYGLFQINGYWQRNRFNSVEELKNAETNIKIAAEIWEDSGWSPWYGARKIGVK